MLLINRFNLYSDICNNKLGVISWQQKVKELAETPGGQLSMRMPKFGAYQDASIYDFNDDPDDVTLTKLEHRRTSNPIGSPNKVTAVSSHTKDEKKTDDDSDTQQDKSHLALKLKVSGGKIIGFVVLNCL